MFTYQALTDDGTWSYVELLEFLVVKGKVCALVALVGSGFQSIQQVPLEELRVRRESDKAQWSFTSGGMTAGHSIVDARAQSTRYFDL